MVMSDMGTIAENSSAGAHGHKNEKTRNFYGIFIEKAKISTDLVLPPGWPTLQREGTIPSLATDDSGRGFAAFDLGGALGVILGINEQRLPLTFDSAFIQHHACDLALGG